jgi:hypothetical protein
MAGVFKQSAAIFARVVSFCLCFVPAWSQQAPAPPRSPEIGPARMVTFRLKTYTAAAAMPKAVNDGAMANNQALAKFLTAHEIKFTFRESEGAHTWMVWRTSLLDSSIEP